MYRNHTNKRFALVLLALAAMPAGQGCVFLGAIPLAAIGGGAWAVSGQEEETEYEPEPTFPVVTGIWPDSGPVSGGTSVQVFGLRFQSGATVTIGGNPATNVVFVSSTELTCDTPAGTVGAADVVVENPDGQSATLAVGYAFEVSGDTIPPGVVSDLAAAQGASDGEVELTWTAPGDDGTTGTASAYVLKYSTGPISAGDFNAARTYAQAWTPLAGGSGESKTLTGLTPGIRYFFALKAQDEAPNVSAMSNAPWGLARCSTLLAYWPLEDGSGGTATDVSGNGNDATLNGCTWTSGKVGGALQFNGTSDYADSGIRFTTPALNCFSFSIWFSAESTGSGLDIMIGSTTGVTDTAITGAPSTRYGMNSVWTGKEMIGWSGFNGSINPTTGGRYRP